MHCTAPYCTIQTINKVADVINNTGIYKKKTMNYQIIRHLLLMSNVLDFSSAAMFLSERSMKL